jgi:hypothetical protein
MSRATQARRLRADPMRPVLDGHDVCLDPPATAQVWLGTGLGFSEIAVPGVRLARGDALVAVELAAVGPDEVLALVGRGAASLPVVPGGSAVGRVVEADEHARAHDGRRLRSGMRVVWSGTVTCGRCVPCHRGLASACVSGERYGEERTRRSWQLSGAVASHVHLRRGTAVVVVADDVPGAVLAPVAGVTATAEEVLHRASSVLGLSGVPSLADQVVVVSGAGAVGLVATAMAADAGARVVVATPRRRGASGRARSAPSPWPIPVRRPGRTPCRGCSRRSTGRGVTARSGSRSTGSPGWRAWSRRWPSGESWCWRVWCRAAGRRA